LADFDTLIIKTTYYDIYSFSFFPQLFLTSALLLIFYPTSSSHESDVVEIESEPAPKSRQFVKVLVPIREIQAGSKLDSVLFREETRPAGLVSKGMFHAFEEIKGKYAKTLIVRGRPLSVDYTTSVRSANHILDGINDGYRAVTIRVNQQTGVGGWAWPGARVDVVLISGRNRDELIPLVDNAKILAVEQLPEIKNSSEMLVPSNVTLSVTATDANRIQLAGAVRGSLLSLNLRGGADSGKGSANKPIKFTDLTGGIPPKKDTNYTGYITIGGQKYGIDLNGKFVQLHPNKSDN